MRIPAIVGMGLAVLATSACAELTEPPPPSVEAVSSALTFRQLRIGTPAPVADGTTLRLDQLGSWVHWGLSGTAANRGHQPGNPILNVAPLLTKVGGGTIQQYPAGSPPYPQYSWILGSPTASATTKKGVSTINVNTGFQFTYPVLQGTERLRIYVTLFKARASLQVAMPGVPTASVTLAETGSARRTFAVDVTSANDLSDGTQATVTLRFTENLGSGFIVLHAVALAQLPLAYTTASTILSVAPPPGVPQPPLYRLEGYFSEPLVLAGSRIDLRARLSGLGETLWGWETSVFSAIVREGRVTGGNLLGDGGRFLLPAAGSQFVSVVGIGQSGSRSGYLGQYVPAYAYAFSDAPLALPDLQCASRSLTINTPVVPNREVGPEIDVSFSISHTYLSDLTIELISPAGTAVVIAEGLAAGQADMAGTRIHGNGNRWVGIIPRIDEGSPPYSGAFLPSNHLAAMDGQPVNGTWTLRVCDRAAEDQGTLHNVRLYVLPD